MIGDLWVWFVLCTLFLLMTAGVITGIFVIFTEVLAMLFKLIRKGKEVLSGRNKRRR